MNNSPAFVLPTLLLAVAALAAGSVSALDGVFKDVVVSGRVDYTKLTGDRLAAVNAYIDGFVDLGAPDQPLADYINLYNAVMLKAVVEKRAASPAWKPSDNDFGVFKEPRVPLKGGMKSLNDLENEIIRKQYKEPRIHAALNCAALSCPPLIPRAYSTETLETQLEANMKAFVNDPVRNVFDDKAKTMKLSRIFDWFAADFGGKDKLPDYLAKYRPGNYNGWKIEYQQYDWTLNEAK